MTHLLNSVKQNIIKYHRTYMFILLAFNATRTACVCVLIQLKDLLIKPISD